MVSCMWDGRVHQGRPGACKEDSQKRLQALTGDRGEDDQAAQGALLSTGHSLWLDRYTSGLKNIARCHCDKLLLFLQSCAATPSTAKKTMAAAIASNAQPLTVSEKLSIACMLPF